MKYIKIITSIISILTLFIGANSSFAQEVVVDDYCAIEKTPFIGVIETISLNDETNQFTAVVSNIKSFSEDLSLIEEIDSNKDYSGIVKEYTNNPDSEIFVSIEAKKEISSSLDSNISVGDIVVTNSIDEIDCEDYFVEIFDQDEEGRFDNSDDDNNKEIQSSEPVVLEQREQLRPNQVSDKFRGMVNNFISLFR